jgi:hypothetical protein
MDDDRFERLLKGYALPDVSPGLDRRVLREGATILWRTHTLATLEEVGRSLLHSLGFGYVAWLTDLVTTTDAEYRVDLI